MKKLTSKLLLSAGSLIPNMPHPLHTPKLIIYNTKPIISHSSVRICYHPNYDGTNSNFPSKTNKALYNLFPTASYLIALFYFIAMFLKRVTFSFAFFF